MKKHPPGRHGRPASLMLISGPRRPMTGRKQGGEMRKIGVFATVAILGAGLLGTTLIPASSQQAATIRVYERHRSGSERYINNDGKRSIAGDFILQVKPLYRSGTQKRVGREVVHVTLIRPLGKNNAMFRVAATFVLGAGKVEAAGTSTVKHLRRGAAFTITGGTGDYAGASGSLNVREGKRRTFFTFLINT
jgi:hypothetical protein